MSYMQHNMQSYMGTMLFLKKDGTHYFELC